MEKNISTYSLSKNLVPEKKKHCQIQISFSNYKSCLHLTKEPLEVPGLEYERHLFFLYPWPGSFLPLGDVISEVLESTGAALTRVSDVLLFL